MRSALEWLRGRARVRREVPFARVPHLAALDSFFSASADGPVVLFNHDPYCPVSAAAYRRVAALPETSVIALVDVAHAKDVTAAIAQRIGIRHESPQVIVVRHGRAVWSASHWEIDTSALIAALAHYAENDRGDTVSGSAERG